MAGIPDPLKDFLQFPVSKICILNKEGSSINWQNLNETLETLNLAPTLFYHLLLNLHPLF